MFMRSGRNWSASASAALSSGLSWSQWRQILAVAYTQFSQGMQLTLPFILGVYMVRDFENGTNISEQRVSRRTGLLAAVYSSSQVITSLPWGFASDRLGRRPVVVIGNLVCTFSIIAFGASGNYGQAAAARFCGGFFNGITGALKTIIGELFADNANGQARALSALSCAWGVGTVFGSIIGGALADPCRLYGDGFPQCGAGGLLTARPFLLPCAAVGVLSFFSAVISVVVLEETLPSSVRHGAGKYEQVAGGDPEASDCQLASLPRKPDRIAVPVDQPVGTELLPITWVPTHNEAPHPLPTSSGHRGGGEGGRGSSTSSWHTADSDGLHQQAPLSYAVSVAAGSNAGDAATHHHQQQPREQQQQHSQTLLQQQAQQQQQWQHGREQQQNSQHLQQQQAQKQQEHRQQGREQQQQVQERSSPQQQLQQTSADSCIHLSVGRRRSAHPHDRDRTSEDKTEDSVCYPAGEGYKCSEWSPRQGRRSSDGSAAASEQQQAREQREDQELTPWYRRREVQLSVAGYGSIALVNTFVNELVPLFAATSFQAGGMALEASQLAGPLTFSGAAFLIYAGFIYPLALRRLGILPLCLIGLVTAAPATAAIPLASLPAAAGNYVRGQAVLYASLALRQVASMNAFTSSIVLVNQSAPAGKLGAVNGAGQMVASAVRGAAPALCGIVWAATLGVQVAGRQFLPFAFSAATLLGIAVAYQLSRVRLSAMSAD